ncbi:MAG: flavodoxin domain-containing protein [Clostridia bacterium]|nr:flavodoxin domain-containing protein [Clostridia bacterium]MBN2883272.1 flavodoxin domain-containing protein [Clostridia bacterium]
MRVLIAYSSKYGSTKDCARKLADKLNCDTEVIDVKKSKPDPRVYDAVIIGGPVYMGKINKPTAVYCELYKELLLSKPLGLFICHMDREKDVNHQISSVYPEELVAHSKVSKGFGGAYLVSNMNFFYKMIIKKAAGVTENKKDIFNKEIDMFAEQFNNIINK